MPISIVDKFAPSGGLSFPEYISGSPSQGHFVQFFVNVQEAGKAKSEGSDTPQESKVAIERAPTRRVGGAITLYMPATVQASYKSNYTDMEIGGLAMAGLSAYDTYNNTAGGGFEAMSNAASAAGDTLVESSTVAMLKALDTVAPGAKAALELRSGKVINNRMEMVFQNIDKRTFSYSFRMLPRTPSESFTIRQIVDTFKVNMLPQLQGSNSSSRTFIVPSTFDIEYLFQGKENRYLNKVSTCVLTQMDVKYGGDRFQTFREDGDGAPPTEVELTLNFQELELITAERAAQGY